MPPGVLAVYRATLALWRTRLHRNWPSVAQLGFDEVFRRARDFYLACSEARFAAGYSTSTSSSSPGSSFP
jgi:cyclopropane fatty-acyl-phospholipid synthase-like methyltransferase